MPDQYHLMCLITTKSNTLEEVLAGQDFHNVMAGIRHEDLVVYYS